MKIDAKIKWLIDEPQFDIAVDKIETVLVDADYVEAESEDILQWIENALSEKYGTSFYECQNDFTVMNMAELIQDISYDEFQDKTEYLRI